MENLILAYSDMTKKDIIGYKNQYGSLVISLKCDDAEEKFDALYVRVKIGGKYGVINRNGEFIILCEYDEILCVPNTDLFVVRINKDNDWTVALFNGKGEILIPFEYKYIEVDKSGFIFCYKCCDSELRLDKRKNDFDTLYKYDKFQNLELYNNDFLLVYKDNGRVEILCDEYIKVDEGTCCVLDRYGNTIIGFTENFKIIKSFSKYVFRCYSDFVYDREEDCYKPSGERKYINIYGNFLPYDDLEKLTDELLVAEKNNNFGVVDYENNKITNFIFKEIKLLNEYLLIRQDEKNGLLDFKGRLLLSPIYDAIYYANNGIYILEKDSKYIYWTEEKGCFFECEDIMPLHKQYWNSNKIDRFCAIKINGKYGICDITETDKLIVIPCEYDQISYNANEDANVVFVCKDSLWSLINLNSICLSPTLFRSIGILNADDRVYVAELCVNEGEEKFVIISENKIGAGFLDEGTYILLNNISSEMVNDIKTNENECNRQIFNLYPKFTYFTKERILTYKDGKFGFIDIFGSVTVPFIYDEVNLRKDKDFNVRRGNFWGVLSLKGGEIIPVKYKKSICDDYGYDKILYLDEELRLYPYVLSKGKGEIIPPMFYNKICCIEENIYFVNSQYNARPYDLRCMCYNGNYYENYNLDGFGCWGVIVDEKLVLKTKYHFLDIRNDIIIASYKGGFVDNGDGYLYNGVFDLYSINYKFIIKGFVNDLSHCIDWYISDRLGSLQLEYGELMPDYNTNYEIALLKREDNTWCVLNLKNRLLINLRNLGVTNYYNIIDSCKNYLLEQEKNSCLKEKENEIVVLDLENDNLSDEYFVEVQPIFFRNFLLLNAKQTSNKRNIFQSVTMEDTSLEMKKKIFIVRLDDFFCCAEYDNVEFISSDVFVYYIDNLCGLSVLEKQLTEACYDEILFVNSTGYAKFRIGNKFGIFNLNTLVGSKLYDEMFSINDNLVKFRINDKYGILDLSTLEESKLYDEIECVKQKYFIYKVGNNCGIIFGTEEIFNNDIFCIFYNTNNILVVEELNEEISQVYLLEESENKFNVIISECKTSQILREFYLGNLTIIKDNDGVINVYKKEIFDKHFYSWKNFEVKNYLDYENIEKNYILDKYEYFEDGNLKCLDLEDYEVLFSKNLKECNEFQLVLKLYNSEDLYAWIMMYMYTAKDDIRIKNEFTKVKQERLNFLKKVLPIYKKLQKEEDDYYYEQREERRQMERDTWDAMTGGNYGDMPDGFDGDYDFLGY